MNFDLTNLNMSVGPNPSIYGTKNLRIRKFIVQETGTYNQQWKRPFSSNMDSRTYQSIVDRAVSSKKVTPGIMSGLANQFMQQSATPERHIVIPNGWSERRLRFFLEIEIVKQMGAVSTEYVYGYSDYFGLSNSSYIDPEMTFTINGINRARNMVRKTALGNQLIQNSIDSTQLIVAENYGGVRHSGGQYMMRPEDIYTHMDTADIMREDDIKDVFDTSLNLTNIPIKSNRANNIAPVYVANMIDSYITSSDPLNPNGSQDKESMIQNASSYLQSAVATEDDFLSALRKNNYTTPNTFTYNDLLRLDPNVKNVTAVLNVDNVRRSTLHQTGLTEDWATTTYETVIASTISQALPGYMVEFCINNIKIFATNRDISGKINLNVIEVKSLMQGVDITTYIERLCTKIESELLQDISYNNQMDFALEISCDLFGETYVNVSINNGPFILYSVPSFCDSLMSPIITNNYNTCINLAADFKNILDTVVDNRGSATFLQQEPAIYPSGFPSNNSSNLILNW